MERAIREIICNAAPFSCDENCNNWKWCNEAVENIEDHYFGDKKEKMLRDYLDNCHGAFAFEIIELLKGEQQ